MSTEAVARDLILQFQNPRLPGDPLRATEVRAGRGPRPVGSGNQFPGAVSQKATASMRHGIQPSGLAHLPRREPCTEENKPAHATRNIEMSHSCKAAHGCTKAIRQRTVNSSTRQLCCRKQCRLYLRTQDKTCATTALDRAIDRDIADAERLAWLADQGPSMAHGDRGACLRHQAGLIQ